MKKKSLIFAFIFFASYFSFGQSCPSTCAGNTSATFNGVPARINCGSIPCVYGYNYETGINTGYRWQCVEYVNRYYKIVYGINLLNSSIYGNAKNYWTNSGHSDIGLTKYPNGGAEAPQVGDMIVSTYSTYGHIAIVTSVSSSSVGIIDQNFNLSNSSRTLSRNGNTVGSFGSSYSVAGWIRKNSVTPSSPYLITPSSGQTNVTTPVNFTWSAANATTYRIQIVENAYYSGFSAANGLNYNGSSSAPYCTNCAYEGITSNGSFTWNGAQPGKVYAWAVRAANSSGSTDFVSSAFKIATPQTISFSSPTGGTFTSGQNITITHLSSDGSASVALELVSCTGSTSLDLIASSASSNGSRTYNLPSGLNGQYRIKAYVVGTTGQPFYSNCFSVTTAATPPPVVSASKPTICNGESVTLSSSNCSGTVNWNNGLGSGSSKAVSPSSTTTYSATCTANGVTSGNSNGVTVSVNQNPPTPNLSASPASINSGQSSTLTVTNCGGTVNWNNGLGTGGSKVVSPTVSTVYSANCQQNGCVGNTSSVTVTVNQNTPPPTVSVNTSSICIGEGITLSASNCSGTINWNNGLGSGSSKTAYPTSTTTYSATCTANGITSGSSNGVTVTVNQNPPTPNLTASPASINSGQSSTLTVSNCGGTVNWNNGLGTGNSKVVSPSSTTVYSANCQQNGCVGNSSSVTVTVTPACQQPDLTISDIQVIKYTSDKIYYRVSVKNTGSETASLGSFNFATYGSPIATNDNSAVQKNVMFLGGGSLGKDQTINYDVWASMNYHSNHNYFLVQADHYGLVSECDKTNNWGSKLVKPCSNSGNATLSGLVGPGLVATNGTFLIPNGVFLANNTVVIARNLIANAVVQANQNNITLQTGNCLDVPAGTVTNQSNSPQTSGIESPKEIFAFTEQQINTEIKFKLEAATNLTISIWDQEAQAKLKDVAVNQNYTAGDQTLDLSGQNLVKGKTYIVHFATAEGQWAMVVAW